jgi:hypothetical protein
VRALVRVALVAAIDRVAGSRHRYRGIGRSAASRRCAARDRTATPFTGGNEQFSFRALSFEDEPSPSRKLATLTNRTHVPTHT